MTAIERIEDWTIEIRRYLLKTTIHVLSLPYHRQFGSFVEPNSSKVGLSSGESRFENGGCKIAALGG